MAIEIFAERVVTSDLIRKYKILDIKALRPCELPEAYKKMSCYCYLEYYYSGKGIVYIDKENKEAILRCNYYYTPTELANIVAKLEVCGVNLKRVNDEKREMEESWAGKLNIRI